MITTLKKADLSDTPFLWYLRNQPEVYRYFKHPKPVTWEEHINWTIPVLLELVLKELYVIRYGTLPVGQLRFDYEGEEIEVSISLVKEFRGKGIASKALAKGIAKMKRAKKVRQLIAEIYRENAASVSLFEKHGFTYQKTKGDYHYYTLSL